MRDPDRKLSVSNEFFRRFGEAFAAESEVDLPSAVFHAAALIGVDRGFESVKSFRRVVKIRDRFAEPFSVKVGKKVLKSAEACSGFPEALSVSGETQGVNAVDEIIDPPAAVVAKNVKPAVFRSVKSESSPFGVPAAFGKGAFDVCRDGDDVVHEELRVLENAGIDLLNGEFSSARKLDHICRVDVPLGKGLYLCDLAFQFKFGKDLGKKAVIIHSVLSQSFQSVEDRENRAGFHPSG